MARGAGKGAGRGAMDDQSKKVAGCCCFVVLFVASFLIGFSFRIVDEGSYGLKFNELDKKADPDAYDTGRHAIGLGNVFIAFPKTAQRVGFTHEDEEGPITVRTIDGFSMTIEVVYWYKLRKDTLFPLYEAFKQGYEAIFIKSSRSTLRDVAASFTGLEFASEDGRVLVEHAMHEAMVEDLVPQYGSDGKLERGGAELIDFQLRRIFLPERLESQKLTERLIDMDRQITSVETDLVRIQTETQSMLTEAISEKNAELGRITEGTTNSFRIIDAERVSIEENTLTEVAEIDSKRIAFLEVFTSTTENLRLSGRRNVTLTEQKTEQLAAQIDAETDLLSAAAEETIFQINAEASAAATVVENQAEAQAQRVVSAALKDAFEGWALDLNFTAEDIHTLQWTEAMAAADGRGQASIDLQRPTMLDLPGQREAMENSN
mmetsp:Transcript_11257/g.26566  ORF Transcript_11257/g.26566 Transcript_11257/m.26566 type:complete len:433 (-) Transcript_11257:76-1374(-)